MESIQLWRKGSETFCTRSSKVIYAKTLSEYSDLDEQQMQIKD